MECYLFFPRFYLGPFSMWIHPTRFHLFLNFLLPSLHCHDNKCVIDLRPFLGIWQESVNPHLTFPVWWLPSSLNPPSVFFATYIVQNKQWALTIYHFETGVLRVFLGLDPSFKMLQVLLTITDLMATFNDAFCKYRISWTRDEIINQTYKECTRTRK